MMLLTVEETMALHTKLIAKTGGSDGLRDRGLLESAVYSAESSFGGEDVYPTVEEKAARLMYGLVGNHAFVDGNKRIGVFVMLLTLQLNGVVIRYTQSELIDLGLGAADGAIAYPDILRWISEHRV